MAECPRGASAAQQGGLKEVLIFRQVSHLGLGRTGGVKYSYVALLDAIPNRTMTQIPPIVPLYGGTLVQCEVLELSRNAA